MKNRRNNYAYIDGANLYRGIESLGWQLDYRRFRIWLYEKYGVSAAYLFIGLISKYKYLYKYLQKSGFILTFKEVVYDSDGKPKGNCDADLVLQATRDFYEGRFDNALLVSSDGDFYCLVGYLYNQKKLKLAMSPYIKTCSVLLKRSAKEKTPHKDKTFRGAFSCEFYFNITGFK